MSIQKILLARIESGVNEYHKAVEAMTDQELYEHCFLDETEETDFCMIEWRKRELNKNDFLTTNESSN